MKKHTYLSLLAMILTFILFVSACAPSPVEVPTQDIGPMLTEIAEALLEELPENTPVSDPTATPELLEATPPEEEMEETEQAAEPTEEATPTETSTPTVTPTPEPVAAPGFRILLEDDFSSSVLWYTNEDDKFSFTYKDDGYAIEVNILNSWIWSRRGPDDLADVRLEVDARHNSGPTNGYYGVFCRYLDEDNYYALAVSEEGEYVIAKRKDREFEFLAQDKDENNVIKTDGTVNRVTGDCLGGQLTLTVNGTQLLQVEDTDFASGASGAIAASRLTPGFEALFTYYRLSVRATP
jgi:hypothetical protein